MRKILIGVGILGASILPFASKTEAVAPYRCVAQMNGTAVASGKCYAGYGYYQTRMDCYKNGIKYLISGPWIHTTSGSLSWAYAPSGGYGCKNPRMATLV